MGEGTALIKVNGWCRSGLKNEFKKMEEKRFG
jgi:hypothetical protein